MRDSTGEARTSSYAMYSNGPPHMAKQNQDDQLKHTYSSYVRIRDVALRTCQRRWTIGRSGERGSGISILAAWHDDDDDDDDECVIDFNFQRMILKKGTHILEWCFPHKIKKKCFVILFFNRLPLMWCSSERNKRKSEGAKSNEDRGSVRFSHPMVLIFGLVGSSGWK